MENQKINLNKKSKTHPELLYCEKHTYNLNILLIY